MLISVKPLAKNLCIRFGTWKVRRLNQSRSKVAPNWKAKFPAFLFYGLPFLKTQFKAIILNKDCHDTTRSLVHYYTVTSTQRARNVLLQHRRPRRSVCQKHGQNGMSRRISHELTRSQNLVDSTYDWMLPWRRMSWFARGDLWSLPTAFDDQSVFYSDDVLSLPQRRLQSQY